jgi:small GTP-binding protein
VVLGRGTVGKTSLIFRYVNNMCPKEHDATVEDSYSVHITTATGEERQFKILDTAGEEDYQTMVDEWIKVADGFLLLFAINDKESFDILKIKMERIKKNNKEKVPIILVGNKCDLEDKREIATQQGIEYAKNIGAKYYETSALTDSNGNCKVVFQQCAHLILNGLNQIENPKPSCPLCNIW